MARRGTSRAVNAPNSSSRSSSSSQSPGKGPASVRRHSSGMSSLHLSRSSASPRDSGPSIHLSQSSANPSPPQVTSPSPHSSPAQQEVIIDYHPLTEEQQAGVSNWSQQALLAPPPIVVDTTDMTTATSSNSRTSTSTVTKETAASEAKKRSKFQPKRKDPREEGWK